MPFKNDNLDDLFKKAASDYPLNTDNSSWDSVATKLKKPFFKQVIGKRNAAIYAILIMLMATGSVWMYKLNTPAPAAALTEKEKSGINNTASEEKRPGAFPEPTAKTSIAGSTQTGGSNAALFKSAAVLTSNSSLLLPVLPALVIMEKTPAYTIRAMVNKPSPFINQNMMASKPAYALVQGDDYEENVADALDEPGYAEDDAAERVSDNGVQTENRLPKRFRQSPNSFYKLYGTAYAGPEFSTVKFQQVNKPGYKIGVSLGFRMNNRFNIEVGLQREHISFYSDGKYLDTTMLKIKSNTAVENVNINSKLTSVPVALRYNFLSKSRGHFFVTAGVNALMITHSEQYQFAVSNNGVADNLSKSYSALTPPKYFSGVNASVGYELQLPKLCSMKVESYYQAPVNDLGVGQLPVTSFGLNIGIVKNLK